MAVAFIQILAAFSSLSEAHALHSSGLRGHPNRQEMVTDPAIAFLGNQVQGHPSEGAATRVIHPKGVSTDAAAADRRQSHLRWKLPKLTKLTTLTKRLKPPFLFKQSKRHQSEAQSTPAQFATNQPDVPLEKLPESVTEQSNLLEKSTHRHSSEVQWTPPESVTNELLVPLERTELLPNLHVDGKHSPTAPTSPSGVQVHAHKMQGMTNAKATGTSDLQVDSRTEVEQQSHTQAALPFMLALSVANKFQRSNLEPELPDPRGWNGPEDQGIVASPTLLEPARTEHLLDPATHDTITLPGQMYSIKVNRKFPFLRPGGLDKNSWVAFYDKHTSAELREFLQRPSWQTHNDLRKVSTAVGQELLGLKTPLIGKGRREQALLAAKQNGESFILRRSLFLQKPSFAQQVAHRMDDVVLFETDTDYVAIYPFDYADNDGMWVQRRMGNSSATYPDFHVDQTIYTERQDAGSLFLINLWQTFDKNKQLLLWDGITAEELHEHALLRQATGRWERDPDVERVKKAAAEDDNFALTSLPGNGSMTLAFVSASSRTDGQKLSAALPHAGVLHNPPIGKTNGDVISQECRFWVQFIPKSAGSSHPTS